jgi:hypothetical protein
MAKPENKKENHGQSVSTFVHELQAARVPGEHPGLGRQVSEFARDKDGGGAVDFEDGVIKVVKADGTSQTFTTFADALAFSEDGDTLQVGAGVYTEAFDLDESVTIVGEAGAVVDASAIAASAGTQGTIQLFDGFSGGSIEGLTLVAVDGGNALVSIIGQAITDVALTGNTFDAGDNTAGSVVYLNPGVDGAQIEGNTFAGAALTDSPLLGVEADNVTVVGNTFGETPGPYVKVEVFGGPNGVTTDVVLDVAANIGLTSSDVIFV